MLAIKQKVLPLYELYEAIRLEKNEGKKVVHCHGVFDLVHPGHIRHLREARAQGDLLVVTITPDRFVNKGPGRPVFTEALRAETLSALAFVDYVSINTEPTAITAIQSVAPDVYIKGIEYKEHDKDVTGKIAEEVAEVEKHGGTVYYTDDITFSSSKLLNEHFEDRPGEVDDFLSAFTQKYSFDLLHEMVESLATLSVLVVGDAILDEYQFVAPLGQSGKGLHMVAELHDNEMYLGGVFAIANHLAELTEQITCVTAVGDNCPYAQLISSKLSGRVTPAYFPSTDAGTLVKKRYVMKDGDTLSKLFETYSSNKLFLNPDQTEDLKTQISERSKDVDLVLVADFGNGFLSPKVNETLSSLSTFTAINTQTNSGNRGFNVITKYANANFVSINEPELRLAMHDTYSSIEKLASTLIEQCNIGILAITQGVEGVRLFDNKGHSVHVPALSTSTVDRVGAGDSFLSYAALAAAKRLPLDVIGFFGALAAAIDIQIVGNKEPVHKQAFLKFMTRVLK